MIRETIVSIIIPTYNRESLIGETLDSIINQSYCQWECLVIDDGSDDNTAEIVNDYCCRDPRIAYYLRPAYHLPGGNGARNYGLSLSKGKFIQWFDSDDLMLPNYLEKKVDLINQGSFKVVFCGYDYFGVNQVKGKLGNMAFSGDVIESLLKREVNFSPPSFLLSREVLNTYLFDEKISRYQDLDFFFRLFISQPTLTIGHVPEVLFRVRKHGMSISRKRTTQGKEFVSMLLVHQRIYNYFKQIEHGKGKQLYRRKCLGNLKSMLDRRRYAETFKRSINATFLGGFEKIIVLGVITIHSFTRKGGDFIKNL